jgi:hypothetical protein
MRTVESVSLQGRVISQKVNLEFRLPALPTGPGNRRTDTGSGAAAGEVYIPALLVRKPELIDNLSIVDAQGQALSALPYEETANLVAVTLHFLLVSCTLGQSGNRPDQQPAELPLAVWQTEAQLLRLIHEVGPQPNVDSEIDQAFTRLGLPLDDNAPERVTWLRAFVRTLSQAYPVVVALPPGSPDRVLLTYQRTLIPSLDTGGIRGRLRLALGLRPFNVGVGTALANATKSYHLHVQGPPTQYLMEQTLRCSVCQRPLTRNGVDAPDGPHTPGHRHEPFPGQGGRPYFELRSKRGQSYAHLYMRGFANSSGDHLVLSASFGETPPATLAGATITAAISALLIGIIGHAEVAGINHGSDIPPLLLALPTAAASWFGFNSDGEAVLRSSLAARCSLFVSGIASLVAACVFLATKRPTSPHTAAAPSMFGMHLPSWWSVLLVIAFVNLMAISTQLMIRSWSYRRLLLRKENDGIHTGHRLE